MKPRPTSKPKLVDLVARIESVTDHLTQFWAHADGWAPEGAGELLGKSRLDRFSGLTKCLRLWVRPTKLPDLEGGLILAWTNLGSLAESAIKLYLAVFYQDYCADVKAPSKKGKRAAPDELTLEQLRQYLERKDLLSKKSRRFVSKIQPRRNAIHSFRHRDIGTFGDFRNAVRSYLSLLEDVNNHLPYPDGSYDPGNA